MQRAEPARQGWEEHRAYWEEPAYLRRPGFRPRTSIDVGVGHGTPQLYAAFPDARLILVEPLAEFFEEIGQTLARRRGVHISAAAGSSEGELELRVEPRGTERSSHYSRHSLERTGDPLTPRRVQVTTIVRIIASHAFPEPFALKIDTEGAELEVIRGAAATLERTLFVIAEVGVLHHRFEGSYSFAQFIAAMDQAGFEVCDLLGIGRAASSASNLTFLPMHKRRATLRRYLLEHAPDLVDHFGRGVRWVPRKWDVLAPYRFSFAIENSVGPHLWTEKVADCFLAWTVPLYYGCTNLEQYFPEDSFLRIDANNPAAVRATLERLRESNEWERRLPALEVARRRVLGEYQISPWLARAINTYGLDPGPAAAIHIPGYRWRRWRHRLRYLHRKIRAGEAADLVSVLINKAQYIRWFDV